MRVVDVADPDSLALAVGAQLAPVARPYLDAALLVAQPHVAVVTICTTPDRHVGLVLAAILAGKHVVCDKPLGLFLSEFDTAVAAAMAHRVVLGLNLVLRHHPLYAFLHALARSGARGPLRASPSRTTPTRPAGLDQSTGCGIRRCGGLALAADNHWLDLAVRLLGPAHEVHAWELSGVVGAGPRRLVTAAHAAGAMASIYHAFDTYPGAAGGTVLAAFEEGEVRVDGWIPTTLTLACRPERNAAVAALLDPAALPTGAALLDPAALPTVALDPDRRAVLVLQGNRDRRAAYLEMVQTTLQQVLDAAQGRNDATDLGNARHATAAALAAEVAVVSRDWVQVGADGPPEATG